MLDLNEPRLDPGHREIRGVARVLGPLLVIVGVIFIAVGMVSFFSAMGSLSGGPPQYFWCCFVGAPLFALGMALSQFGYLGWFTRYVAGETAPVQKDTFNYLARGVQPGVTDLVRAVRDGFKDESPENPAAEKKYCPNCGQVAALPANFCSGCGQKFEA